MDSIKYNSIPSFKALNENEIKAVRKACIKLSNRVACRGTQKVDVGLDIAEIGGKTFLYSKEDGKLVSMKIEMNGFDNTTSYTNLEPKTIENAKNFLKSNEAVEKFSDIIDSLKHAINRATAKEGF